MIDLISALYTISLMFALKCFLLNIKYVLMYVPKALAQALRAEQSRAEQSRAEQKLTAGNQPARPFLALSSPGTHGAQSSRLLLYRLRMDHTENTSYSCTILLYALPSNELFTKNLSSRELVYRAVA
jgi:hypothetical protein